MTTHQHETFRHIGPVEYRINGEARYLDAHGQEIRRCFEYCRCGARRVTDVTPQGRMNVGSWISPGAYGCYDD